MRHSIIFWKSLLMTICQLDIIKHKSISISSAQSPSCIFLFHFMIEATELFWYFRRTNPLQSLVHTFTDGVDFRPINSGWEKLQTTEVHTAFSFAASSTFFSLTDNFLVRTLSPYSYLMSSINLFATLSLKFSCTAQFSCFNVNDHSSMSLCSRFSIFDQA